MPAVNSNLTQALVRDKLDAQLPDEYNVYARRDFTVLPADQFPAGYVVMLPEIVLEEESDNQTLIGYPAGVVLMFKSAGDERDDTNPLTAARRIAEQAVYTTDYGDTQLEQVLLDETVEADLPGDLEGITATGFTVILGFLETRESTP